MATIRERNGRYHVQVRLKGHKPVTKSFEKRTDAVRWTRVTEAALLEGRYSDPTSKRRYTFEDLVERYFDEVLPTKSPKAQTLQRTQLQYWLEQLGHFFLDELENNPLIIAERKNTLSKSQTRFNKPYSPATVTRYLAVLSHAFTVAGEWQWIKDNPLKNVSKPKQPRGRVRFLSDDERERLLLECKRSYHPYLYPVVIVAISTGMRRGEILSLKWQDVDFARNRIILHETKNGERRSVPLVALAREVLEGLSKVRQLDTALVFPGRTGKPAEIRTAWEKALQDATIADFRFHDLRHTAASYLAMNGASLLEIAEILGHKTLAMAKRYSHLLDSHTTQVVEKMNQKMLS